MYAHQFPKDKAYREPLEPFIGMKITVSGTYDRFEVKGAEECEETYMLIKDVSVVENPRLSGKISHKPVDHMWIMIPDDYVVRNRFRKGDILECKGFLYEYAKNIGNNPVRNIGLNLIKTKVRKQQKEAETTVVSPTFIIQAKRKATIENYKTEIAMQIENIIQNQGIVNFADLTAILHEYPVLYEVVMRNPEYFRIIIEACADKTNKTVTVIPAPPVPLKTMEDKKHIIKVGNTEYDLSASTGKNGYKQHLNKLVQKYVVDTPSLTKPKEKIYIIGDSTIMMGIQDKTSKNYTAAKKMETFLNAHSFIDICCYDVSGNFKYRHLDMFSF